MCTIHAIQIQCTLQQPGTKFRISTREIATALHMQSADDSEPTCSEHCTDTFIKKKSPCCTIVKVTVHQGRLYYRSVYTEIAITIL